MNLVSERNISNDTFSLTCEQGLPRLQKPQTEVIKLYSQRNQLREKRHHNWLPIETKERKKKIGNTKGRNVCEHCRMERTVEVRDSRII